jgi:PLD-like domain
MLAHFHNLSSVICEAIASAKKEVKIAVCWFTLPEIFDALLQKSLQNVDIQIIVNFDQLNFQASGLPFMRLIEQGGKVFGYVGHGLLHHKFLIVDNQIVINGSYNWTRSNHHDSLLQIHDETIAKQFEIEWNTLLPFSKNLAELDKSQAKKVSIAHLFQPAFWQLNDLRRNLIKGANLWTVQMSQKPFGKNQKYPSLQRCLSQQIWYLPACKNVTDKAIETQGVFHENIFQNIENETIIKNKNFNNAKIFCKKCNLGDLALAIEQQQIIAVGVVMSEPLYNETMGLYCSVEWQKLPSPIATTFKFSPSPTARILNGGLAILAQCFTK